ncbi:MAG: ABC transporter ATP-binding protein [Rhodospirillales bacterium]|jgi:peptide/nickel transport system ATP-binding protein|nr:ABC transporter ATP-binding protein [Rhodospirillales bacterium]
MSRLLTIKDLKIEGYQEEKWNGIVHGVSLTLERGEVIGLIGESGAGKSTIGIASMGYARPGCRITGGSIEFDGMDLAQASDEELRKLRGVRIAYVAQSAAASFNPAHTLLQQFAETPVKHGVMTFAEAEVKAIELYRSLDLPNPESIGSRYPHQVSGGQLQRAMVAMAMSCDPDLIIFDEPTTALDVTTQIEVLSSIKNAIKQHNTAAIYITHDLAVVAQISDRIMVLRYGNEVETGLVGQIVQDPKEDYTRELLSVRNVRHDTMEHSDSDSTILEVKNISASYGNGVRVLNNVSTKVTKGMTVAVVGESGSGKSTMARVITGLLPPEEGEILFHGQPLSPSFKDRSLDLLQRIQMIYQMPDVALNPRQKVKDVIGRSVEFYTGLKGEYKKARVLELIEKIELSDSYLDRFPSELSGGEKQRVCIARALAAEPELIICDEVTSALDQLVAKEILTLLQDLQNELGMSYLFITHDLATVKAISDDIVVMYGGEVVEQGSKTEILTPPHHDYTDLLLSSVPEMDPNWLDGVLQHRLDLEARGVIIHT